MGTAWSIFAQSFWRARAIYGQFWLMVLVAGVFGGMAGVLGVLSRTAGMLAMPFIVGLVGVLLGTLLMGGIYWTGRAAILNQPRKSVWSEGFRLWGRVWGLVLALFVWFIAVMVVGIVLSLPFSIGAAMQSMSAATALGMSPFAALGAMIPVVIVFVVLYVAAIPFMWALEGAIFMADLPVLVAIGPAFRTAYSRKGFWQYLGYAFLFAVVAALVEIILMAVPVLGVILALLVEPVLLWASVVLTLALWLSVNPGGPSAFGPTVMSAGPAV